MSSDFSLHIVTDNLEEKIKLFLMQQFWQGGKDGDKIGFSEVKINNEWIHYEDWDLNKDPEFPEFDEIRDVYIDLTKEEDIDICCNTPHVNIGEVSFLKYEILNDEKYIPSPINIILDLINTKFRFKDEERKIIIGEFTIIDDKLINDIKNALNIGNNSYYKLSNINEIIEFLNLNKGKKIFYI